MQTSIRDGKPATANAGDGEISEPNRDGSTSFRIKSIGATYEPTKPWFTFPHRVHVLPDPGPARMGLLNLTTRWAASCVMEPPPGRRSRVRRRRVRNGDAATRAGWRSAAAPSGFVLTVPCNPSLSTPAICRNIRGWRRFTSLIF
jgi:hypothetical protein